MNDLNIRIHAAGVIGEGREGVFESGCVKELEKMNNYLLFLFLRPILLNFTMVYSMYSVYKE